MTKKTRKKLTDRPTISTNSLYMYDDCFDSKEPLPDQLIKPKNDKGCDWRRRKMVM